VPRTSLCKLIDKAARISKIKISSSKFVRAIVSQTGGEKKISNSKILLETPTPTAEDEIIRLIPMTTVIVAVIPSGTVIEGSKWKKFRAYSKDLP
jgi:Flp pilus assembly secretin CpaC